jgi:hypothetical protein
LSLHWHWYVFPCHLVMAYFLCPLMCFSVSLRNCVCVCIVFCLDCCECHAFVHGQFCFYQIYFLLAQYFETVGVFH